MKFVECWCCKYFRYLEQENTKKMEVEGLCVEKEKWVIATNDVCKSFMLRSGLYTNRVIPKEIEE